MDVTADTLLKDRIIVRTRPFRYAKTVRSVYFQKNTKDTQVTQSIIPILKGVDAQLPSVYPMRQLNLEWFCYGKISHISSKNPVKMYQFVWHFGFDRNEN